MFQLKWIWKNLKGDRLKFIFGLFLSVVSSLIVIVTPIITATIVDEVVTPSLQSGVLTDQAANRLITLLVVSIGVVAARALIQYGMIMCLEYASQNLILRLRTTLYERISTLDMNFYDHNRAGDLMTRLTGDLDLVRHTIAWISYNFVNCVVLFFTTLVYFCTVNIWLTLALLTVLPIILFLTRSYSSKVRPMYTDLRERLAELNSTAQENIAGNRVVKAFAQEQAEIDRFVEKNGAFRSANLTPQFLWLRYYPVIETLVQSLPVVTLFLGGLFIINGEMTLGELTAFSGLTWTLSAPMQMLGPLLTDLQRFFASANKVIEIYYAQPRVMDRYNAKEMDQVKGKIEFRNVSLKLGKSEILKNVSFTAQPGQTIGIMGETGSGKTTAINCLARFYDVTDGAILVDDVDIREWKLRQLRGSIGTAQQDVFLFSDTAEGNIAFGSMDIPLEEVVRCAEVADADQFIRRLTDGYDTIIGERGVGLSGGQRQRISLARALAIRPPILVLDDTTSAVDMETEQKIQKGLRELDFPCTKLIIAQRISSVKDADQILIFKNGTIVEEGTHQELLDKDGIYTEIFRIQSEGMGLSDRKEVE
ncbi:MAG: ABC transporter ATP-binding protein [Oscillospiraceae bacterium]|nr:ABC transporter ATP-binding protein [Oscillospiraceae bacterium]